MIVGLTGLIGSGKDTVANLLVDKYGFIQMSFASIVKDVLSAIFGWDRDMLEGKTKEHRELRNQVDGWWSRELGIPNFTPRLAMTTIGTDILRQHFNDAIWILALKSNINKILKDNPKARIVISDARYVNELNMIRGFGGMLLEISRGALPDWYDSAREYNRLTNFDKKIYKFYLTHISKAPNFINKNIHSSEYDWIGYKFEHTVFNDWSIETLYQNVDRIMSPLLDHGDSTVSIPNNRPFFDIS